MDTQYTSSSPSIIYLLILISVCKFEFDTPNFDCIAATAAADDDVYVTLSRCEHEIERRTEQLMKFSLNLFFFFVFRTQCSNYVARWYFRV